jgi:hypothetical protein
MQVVKRSLKAPAIKRKRPPALSYLDDEDEIEADKTLDNFYELEEIAAKEAKSLQIKEEEA